MRLLEHEAKELLKGYGIEIPRCQLVHSPGEVTLDGPCAVKAQIPQGGRGKAGGVLMSSDLEDTRRKVQELLSKDVLGYRARRILVEELVEIKNEFFLSITYDTVEKAPLALFSSEGGVEIEELAARSPEKVQMRTFSTTRGLLPFMAREILSDAGISERLLLQLGGVFSRLATLFLETDALVAEINPLVLTPDGGLVALDCHLEIDDDALFRHPQIAQIGKDQQRYEGGRKQTPFEAKAAEIDQMDHRGVAGRLIEFDGDLGLIIGGGGASLTAFDAVRAHGGRPANYCEIGGNPSVRKVKELTKHILSKPGVERIAVIMNVVSNTRVDLVARGVIKGILECGRDPSKTVAVFRIPGAWEEEGFKILRKYGVPFCDRSVSIDEAAKMAVQGRG